VDAHCWQWPISSQTSASETTSPSAMHKDLIAARTKSICLFAVVICLLVDCLFHAKQKKTKNKTERNKEDKEYGRLGLVRVANTLPNLHLNYVTCSEIFLKNQSRHLVFPLSNEGKGA
jgi:hypothetical protein